MAGMAGGVGDGNGAHNSRHQTTNAEPSELSVVLRIMKNAGSQGSNLQLLGPRPTVGQGEARLNCSGYAYSCSAEADRFQVWGLGFGFGDWGLGFTV